MQPPGVQQLPLRAGRQTCTENLIPRVRGLGHCRPRTASRGSETSPAPRRSQCCPELRCAAQQGQVFLHPIGFLLMRSHNFFISMLFFFLISGINSKNCIISLHYAQVCYNCELIDFIVALVRRNWPLFFVLNRAGVFLFVFNYPVYEATSGVFWLCLGSVF